MSLKDRLLRTPTSGSAMLQILAATLRQAGSRQESDIGLDDEDLVHVHTEDKDLLETIHGLEIHSDGEGGSLGDDDGHQSQDGRLADSGSLNEDGEISKSTSALSVSSTREKKSLGERLQAVFDYPEFEEVLGEYTCYLPRTVILRGTMFLTPNRICFYARLPVKQDVVLKEGFFSKKSRTTTRYTRYWFVLKNDVLSNYGDQTDVYHPIKTIDLKHALSAEASFDDDLTFKIFTNEREYKFKTDSKVDRKDWVEVIKHSIFHARMESDKIKISIPFSLVQNIEIDDEMSFTEAIRVRAVESEESSIEEEYLFSYFRDTPRVLDALQARLQMYQHKNMNKPTGDRLFDSTLLSAGTLREPSTPNTLAPRPQSMGFLHPEFHRAPSRSSSPVKSHPSSDTEDNDRSRSALSLSWITDRKSETATTEDVMVSFKKDFSLPDSETPDTIVSGHLLRILPIYGHLFLSDNYLCFKSRFYGTKLILPLSDVQSVNTDKGTRLFFHGLGLVTKTDQEVFFEFSSSNTRDRILKTIRDRTTEEAQKRRLQLRAQSMIETPSLELDDPVDSRGMESSLLLEEPVHIGPFSQGYPGKTIPPMHITCLTIGSRGDVQPYIALCKRLMKDGHKCRISTHGEYKDWVEGHGIEFRLVGGDPGELIELCVENGMFTVAFIRESLKRFRGWLDELLESAWTACQDTNLLIESPSAMAGIHIAEKLDIPYFRAFPFPWTRTRAFPHPFAVPERNLGGSYNYMTYVMIEQVFWKGISGQVNRWRKETLGLGPTSLEKMDANHVPSLYSWSPNVVPAPIDWHSWIHVTGYWFLDNPDLSWTPPEDLMRFLNADPKNKPVYIGFGSMVVPDPDGMTRAIIEAVTKSGVRAIISKGWSDRVTSQNDPGAAGNRSTAEEIVIPPSVYMIKSVPHDWLFPQLAGCVHHGGAGTAAAGLRAGIPTVIKPFFGDQFFWAQRLEDTGVGVWCHELTVKKLTAALVTITTDEKMIRKAQTIGEKIRKEDGVDSAVGYIYHDLGLAKDRLNKNRKEASTDVLPVDLPLDVNGQTADEWEFINRLSSGASGATSTGEGSEGTAGMNVLSGSDEDAISSSSEQLTPTVGAFTELHYTGSLQERRSRSRSRAGSNGEPHSTHLHPCFTDPGPDGLPEIIEQTNDERFGVRSRSKSPRPFLAHVFGQGESPQDKDKDKEKSAKAAKRVSASSAARKVFETVTAKAAGITTKATGYFGSTSGASPASPLPPTLNESPKADHGEEGSEGQVPGHSQGSHDRPSSSHKSTGSMDAKGGPKILLNPNVSTAHNLR